MAGIGVMTVFNDEAFSQSLI